jgi:hypothetical protein
VEKSKITDSLGNSHAAWSRWVQMIAEVPAVMIGMLWYGATQYDGRN